ncbi:ribulose-phosphate 3-epimerase [Ligilactobacillus acidipiscis DSM 15836]|jgi:ribulose-phosphate 3-epimerase|uniref:Ribulose-phosphate 3-epimerase n=2 Tax=Ligilactobacillus acidipiscis TaxID=89059 RepID=A0A0R2K942_9LACO|nr:ribulose-phosphate 3-epimerase [Ligilactobacillus acidipiscis]KRM32208.1 ribulose-phosphate 3-epimerase [Ligilactobacillus acidipiscis DSM 15836]KRN83740.1 ribulose-phosphate 3-epimerase [Ligilactobacillus acidipiscis]MCI1925165.1 ribulose-phosphate 3-epimerase [Ligilactobacillus acidipiscis]MCI1953481.1 ribulose-phosphate 3-epimerase [Ligilactobacillus acidipiscis]SFV40448.1 Ribulose-phosphate 3-epimerase [Ligilactobacillus acidipiscis]
MKIAPSILSADFANLAHDVEVVENAGVEYLHIDIMDGHFVSNLTFGANVVKALRSHSNLVFDCHMMVEDPEKYVADFAQAGADIMGVHAEATPHLHSVLSLIKSAGMKAEVVINPGTPVSMISEVLPMVDQVLVMTVDPGMGGQKFLAETMTKVKQLADAKKKNNLNYDIEVDGGLNDQTVKQALAAGANVIVAGSYIFGADVPADSITALRKGSETHI